MIIFEKEFSDINIPFDDLVSLYERILDAAPISAMGEGGPVVPLGHNVAVEVKKLAQETNTTEQRIIEAAFFAWSQAP